ncbi:hypothetical protein [Actibacterium sp. D379-3]
MTAPATAPGRVILGATSFADADSAIAVAVALAHDSESELVGLLIEEETILACAAGRGALAGGAVPLSVERMLAAYRRDALAFQARIAEAAQGRALRWSFTQRRGRVLPLLSELAGQGDLVLLGHRRAPFQAGAVVAVPGPTDDDPALAQAVRTARGLGRPITILAPAAQLAGAAATALRLGARPDALTLRAVADQAALLDTLNRLDAATVFLGRTGFAPAFLARLSEAARAPVVFPASSLAPPAAPPPGGG